MNDGLFYTAEVPVSEDFNHDTMKKEKSKEIKVRKYFPETWLWADKLAE